MKPRQKVREVAVRIFGAEIGCSDGGCIYGHPGGMHTNGGCGCVKNRDMAHINIQRMAHLAVKLAEEITERAA